jgi:hypothetical protein
MGGQCKPLHPLVGSPRIGKEKGASPIGEKRREPGGAVVA